MEVVLEPGHPHPREEDRVDEGPAAGARAGARLGRPLLIIAEDVEGEALARWWSTSCGHAAGGCRQCLASRSPQGYARGHRNLTGGCAITEDLGIKLENIKLEDLAVKKVTIDKDNTTIVEAAAPRRPSRARQADPRRSRNHLGLRPREAAERLPSSWAVSRSRRCGPPDRDEGEEGRVEDASATKAVVEASCPAAVSRWCGPASRSSLA
jgi:chaperonin GroEL